MTNQSKKARWVDKLLYLMLVALLVVSGTFGITAARFFSSIKGELTATTANPAIQLDYINMKGTEYLGDKSNYEVDEDIEVIDGELSISNLRPGEQKLVEFRVKNWVDQKENLNEVALRYQIVIKTAGLLPLEFTLKYGTGDSTSVTGDWPTVSCLSRTVDNPIDNGLNAEGNPATTFVVYTFDFRSLKHSVEQVDYYKLYIQWKGNVSSSGDAVSGGGEYIKITADWKQYVDADYVQ